MPSPTARQSHIDAALTNVSIGYSNARYVFDQVFPTVTVRKMSDKYFVFDKDSWFRDESAVRAPGGKAKRAEYTLTSSALYICLEKALAKLVTDEEVDNADAPLQPFVTATKFVTDQILKSQEKDVIDLVFGNSNWSNSATPGTLWSNPASEPLEDIETAMFTVAQAIGREPNVGVIGRGLWRYLKNHADLIDRVKYGQTPGSAAYVNESGVAALIGLDRLLVTRSVIENAAEGVTGSQVFIGGTHMWLGYVPAGAALAEPAAGYTFSFKNREVNRFRDDEAHTAIIECRANWDAKITAPDAGYLIKSAA